MILVLICLFLILLGFILLFKCKDFYDMENSLGGPIVGIGGAGLFFAIFIIILANLAVPNTIAQFKIKHDSLVKRLEISDSNYEDLSKSNIIEDITKWNIKVQNLKYFSDSPWTNWFFNKEVVDTLEFIDINIKE